MLENSLMIYQKTKRIYRKINSVIDKQFNKLRRKRINNADFTIICNNCWAGYVYRRYGLPYLTPTVGVYLFADDFIKLCTDLKGYMEKPLKFISFAESKYKSILEEKKQTNIPIARLSDIEIIFLHYATEEEAAEKWKRRVERINYDNLIFKFSKMNCCTDEHLKCFDQFDFPKKICFIPTGNALRPQCSIHFKSAVGAEILDDTSEYSRYINLTKMINSQKVSGNRMEGKWIEK